MSELMKCESNIHQQLYTTQMTTIELIPLYALYRASQVLLVVKNLPANAGGAGDAG